MSSTFTVDRLVAEISRKAFEDYQAFERAFVETFNAHALEFPPGYGWRDALETAIRRQFVRRDQERIVLSL
jgi:hypothetical protein